MDAPPTLPYFPSQPGRTTIHPGRAVHMAENLKRLERLISLITLIHGHGDLNVARLAEKYGVTKRTVFRDLAALEKAGVPLSFNPEKQGYEIRKDFFLPPVQLTVDEALAICALGEQVAGRDQVPFLHVAARAVEKVRGQLPASLRDHIEKLDGHIEIHLACSSHAGEAQDVYGRIRAAIANKRALQCKYDSANAVAGKPSKSAKPFRFDPYALMFSQRAWYAIGLHHGHNEVRTLRLSRFTQVTPLDKPYAIPAEFKLSKHLGNAWRMIRGTPSYDIEIVFDRDFADTISETQWHRTQQTVENDDGTLTFRARVDGLDEIVWWVLSMGPHCVVRKPKALAERVREMAARMLALYPEE